MKKIVFFDIDGTLLDHEKNLPSSTKQAIQQLKDNDVFVAIATGRAPFMFEALREELDIDSYVSFNGQYVVFENEVIYRNPLNKNEIIKLHNDAERLNQTPMVFMNEKTMKSSRKSERITEAMATLKFAPPEIVKDFYEDHDLYQSLLFCTAEEEVQYVGKYDHFDFIRWHSYSIDVLPKRGSKAEGIKRFMDRAGFQMENVYAFGDGLNDIEMLQAVGQGVAMGNALPEVKEHADFITRDVAEDGILYGLKEIGLL